MLGIFWPQVQVVRDKKFCAVSIEIAMHVGTLSEVHFITMWGELTMYVRYVLRG